MKRMFLIKNYMKFFYVKAINYYSNSEDSIWLIGENLGNQASDNGFYFFEYMISNHKKNVYFVYNKEMEELKKFKKNIVKYNSIEHFKLYKKAKYIIVSHGVNDAIPTFIVRKRKNEIKPIIYLQHGIIKFKSIYFNRESYNKSILRFISSSKREQDIITTEMQPKKNYHDLTFNEWKLQSHFNYEKVCEDVKKQKYISMYNIAEKLEANIDKLKNKIGIEKSRVPVTGLARHDSLIRESRSVICKNQILIFPTWRDELNKVSIKKFELSDFYINYSMLLTNTNLINILKKSNFKIKFILHTEMKKYENSFIKLSSTNIIIDQNVKSIRNLILESKYLITDYSSISWEFKLLNRPVIFYQFDYDRYFKLRSNYVMDDSEWFGSRTDKLDSLMKLIYKNIHNNELFEGYSENEVDTMHRDGKNCQRIYNEIIEIPQKVYFLVYNIFGIGGTVKTVINTANYLYQNGYDVEIISVKKTSYEPKLGLDPGIKIKSLLDKYKATKRYKNKGVIGFFKHKIIYLLSKFPSVLINKDEDLYHVFSLFTDLQLYRTIKSLNNCTLVTTIPSFNYLSVKYCNESVKKIGQEHKSFNVHSKQIQEMIKKFYSNLDILTVLTNDDFNSYDKKKIMENDNLFIQPNATEINSLRSDYYKNKPKRIISLARFTKDKRLDILIESFAILHLKYPDWKLDIFGHGEEKQKLNNLIIELELNSVVSIYPSTTNIKKELTNSSIFALPSENEGFGMTILEANSFGIPVVAFNIPNGPRQLIKDYETGLLATPFSIEDYAEKLGLLMANEELRIKLGKNSYEFVKNNYSIEKVGQQFEKLL